MGMKVDFSKPTRDAAIASVQRYFDENMAEPIGKLPAGLLLDFVIEEIGPGFYNRAIADAQARLSQRVGDLSGELFGDELQYWARVDAREAGETVRNAICEPILCTNTQRMGRPGLCSAPLIAIRLR